MLYKSAMRVAAVLCLVCLGASALAQPLPEPRRETPATPAEALTSPKLIAEVPPPYPLGASGAARVVPQLDVDEDGSPGNLLVLGEPQPGFDEAALAAALQLRFEPARRGEQPVAVRIQYAFNFVPSPPLESSRADELLHQPDAPVECARTGWRESGSSRSGDRRWRPRLRKRGGAVDAGTAWIERSAVVSP